MQLMILIYHMIRSAKTKIYIEVGFSKVNSFKLIRERSQIKLNFR